MGSCCAVRMTLQFEVHLVPMSRASSHRLHGPASRSCKQHQVTGGAWTTFDQDCQCQWGTMNSYLYPEQCMQAVAHEAVSNVVVPDCNPYTLTLGMSTCRPLLACSLSIMCVNASTLTMFHSIRNHKGRPSDAFLSVGAWDSNSSAPAQHNAPCTT